MALEGKELAEKLAGRLSEVFDLEGIGPLRFRRANSVEIAQYYDKINGANGSQEGIYKANYFFLGKCLINDAGERLFTDVEAEAALCNATPIEINTLVSKITSIGRNAVEEAAKNSVSPIPDSSPSN